MTHNFINHTGFPVKIVISDKSFVIKNNSSLLIDVYDQDEIEHIPLKRNKIRFPFYKLWKGMLFPDDINLDIICNSYQIGRDLNGEGVIELHRVDVEQKNIKFISVNFGDENPLNKTLYYKTSDLSSIKKKVLIPYLLSIFFVLLVAGIICFVMHWKFLPKEELFAVIGLCSILAFMAVMALRRIKKHVTDDVADQLLHLSLKEQINMLISGGI